jgi:very-short-patch-repair endonuclease
MVDVIVPPDRRMTSQPSIRVIRAVVAPAERLPHKRILVTATERTCLDLARAGREDRLETALRKGSTTASELADSLALGRGRRGQTMAKAAFAEVVDNPWSEPERLMHSRFRSAGITGWRANAPVVVNGGRRYPDIRFDDIKLILEIDGREYHRSDEQIEDDYERQVQLVAAGWTVLQLTAKANQERPSRHGSTRERHSQSNALKTSPCTSLNHFRPQFAPERSRTVHSAADPRLTPPAPRPTRPAPPDYSGTISEGVPRLSVSPRKNAGALSRQRNISTAPATINPRPMTNTTPRPKMLTPVPS